MRPSIWGIYSMPLMKETETLLSQNPPTLIPPPKELLEFVQEITAKDRKPSETEAQLKAKQQVLVEVEADDIRWQQLLLPQQQGSLQQQQQQQQNQQQQQQP
ncbi:hypothetical protein, conserved [Eimeria praecox]|uniref:Uncharacterized protein n=1 Tax=Eimeria praecox TaxID=51316 RepID=U6G244_9EIME|nr:hypothetical protein, conserved [Eimeria praecox]